MDRARQNLAYTEIFAPIDGIVVERNVDVGQTVVASMSTPQLFLIANDLSQMQILASVDESDIGAIHEGQDVRFSVQAYPNQQFDGQVKQVRLQSKTTENVVNYTVVVLVPNKSGKLLPGMTATLEFLTGTATDALLVPNSALRFRPTDEMRAEVLKRVQRAARRERRRRGWQRMKAPPSGTRGWRQAARRARMARGNGSGNGTRAGGGAWRWHSALQRRGGFRWRARAQPAAGARRSGQPPPMLWYLDEGQLTMTRVQAGLTDGQKTAIESPRIKEGMQVIIGVNQPAAAGHDSVRPATFIGPRRRARRRQLRRRQLQPDGRGFQAVNDSRDSPRRTSFASKASRRSTRWGATPCTPCAASTSS